MNARPIAISMGDPGGIGPEIIVKLYTTEPQAMQHTLVVGDAAHLRRAAQMLQPRIPIPIWVVDEAQHALSVPPGCIPLLQAALVAPNGASLALATASELAPWGQISQVGGAWAASSVVLAARLALQNEVIAVVTAPLHKEALHLAGWDFPGHTELLQALTAEHLGLSVQAMPVRMMLVTPELRVVLLSIHLALRDALAAVTVENLLTTLKITHECLSSMLGHTPKIAVAGLNPHAGEGGKFGQEEIAVVAPAIKTACTQGLDVHGPFAPDTVFMRTRQGAFDVVLALYHDQGLIPVKYQGLGHGVNVTLGLPIVRTSPDHGTAFDLAGTGKASAASLYAALNMAREFVIIKTVNET